MAVKRIQIHLCISGFLQTETRCHGILKLSEKLSAAGFNRHVSRVWYRPWNSDWSAVAEHVWLLGQHYDAEILVNVYAYSWGVGWGAVQFARELQKRSLRVQHLVSSDGVYRHPNLLLRWTLLLKRTVRFAPVIRIPGNVNFVHPFHQTESRPQGHRLVVEGTTIISESVRCGGSHSYMDEHKRFHAACLQAAGDLKP